MRFAREVVFIASALFALAAACTSFGTHPNAPPPGSDGGSDAATEARPPLSDGAPDAPPRDAGPLWDGSCLVGNDSFCDSFESAALDRRYTLVKEGGSFGVEDPPASPDSWFPDAPGRSLAAHIYTAGPQARAFVRRNELQLGYRFGMAFSFGVNDHPSAAIVGPRIAATDGPEGQSETIGILLDNRVSVHQTGPGGIEELLDLGPLRHHFWHRLVVEVRRDPTAPGGRGWVYATLDGEPMQAARLATPLATGWVQVGISYADEITADLRVDDLAIINDP